MMKKIQSRVRLQIAAGMASPGPPVGPVLGQRGVNIMEFCRSFNSSTGSLERGIPVPVRVVVYSDRSFSFTLSAPPTAFLLRRAAGIQGGGTGSEGGRVGKITAAQVREVVDLKRGDLTAISAEAAFRCVLGTARSLGLRLEGDEKDR